MPSQDEQLRLAAEVIDKFSKPIQDMQRSLRSLSAETSAAHKAGTAQAKTHSLALGDLKKSVGEVGARIDSGLRPALAGLGVGSLSAAAGITAIGVAIKEFSTAARDLSFLQRQTGLTINQLRTLDALAPRIGSSAQAMNAALGGFNDQMERLDRNALLEFRETWKALGVMPGPGRATEAEWRNLIYGLKGLPRAEQLGQIVAYLDHIRDISQKRLILQTFGLPPEFANLTSKEIQAELNKIKLKPLSDEQIKKGKEAASAFDDLSEAIGNLKDEIGAGLAPALIDATKAITEFVEKNGGELAKSLETIAALIRSGDWAGFARDVRDSAQAVNGVAQQLGGWKTVIEGLIALKLAGWLYGILAPLRMLAGLTAPAWLTGLPTIAAAAGVLTQRSSSGPGSAKTWQDTVDEGRAAGKSFDEISKEQDKKDDVALRWNRWRLNLMNTAPGLATGMGKGASALDEDPRALPPEFFRQMRYVPQTEEGAPRLIKASWSPDAAEGMRPLNASWRQTGGPSLTAGVSAERSIEGAIERGSHKGVYDALWDFVQDQSAEGGGPSSDGAGGVSRASLTPSGAGGADVGGTRGGETIGPGAAFSRSPIGNIPPGQTGQPQYPTSLEQLGGGGASTPSKGDPRGMLAAVRQAAIKNGINPDLMESVARGEGLTSSYAGGDHGTSFGSMQLHRGGAGSVGTEFERQTGLSLSDPRNEKAEIDFAAKWIKNHGWGAWSAARNQGIVGRMGVGIDTSRWAHEVTPNKPPQFTLDDIYRSVEGAQGSAASPQSAVHAGADIAPGAVTAVGGKPPQAFIFHHTGGRGTIEGVQDTLRQRSLGVEYAMDRDGNIRQIGGPGAANILPGSGPGAGLNNRNIVGMEVIGKNDADINAAQVKAAQEFINKNYPNTPVYGHGEVNPGHKEATEGATIVNAIRNARAAAGDQQPVAWAPAAPGQPSPEDQRDVRSFYNPLLGAANRTADAAKETALHGHALRDHFGYRGQFKRTEVDPDLLGNARRAGLMGAPQTHKVTGDANLTVDFVGMPRGIRTKAAGSGMFKTVRLNRGMAMPLASQDF